jgi:ribonucleoside-triphosphate reductase
MEKKENIEEAQCACCGSTNIEMMTRVTGFFSKIHGWNRGKIGELRDRRARDEKHFQPPVS